MKTYIKARYCVWHDLQGWIGRVSPAVNRCTHLGLLSDCRSQNNHTQSFNFALHFIILLWSRHLVAIKSAILESKECNPYTLEMDIQFKKQEKFALRQLS